MRNKKDKLQQIIIIIIFLGLVLISIWGYKTYIINPTPPTEDIHRNYKINTDNWEKDPDGEPCSSEVGG